MVARLPPQEDAIVLKFGGGVHSRASEDEIDPRECHDGQNFILDLENREYRNRKPFDLAATAPNGGQINGFITHQASDGTISFGVQAGDTIYEWDGLSNLTEIATVSSSARLRGRLEHNWNLDDKVLITDLALEETVKEWDGTTFQDVAFTDENGSGFGDFFAKYCEVSKERAFFGHVKDAGATNPHMIVGAERGDFTVITVAQRPASGLGEADPFFLLTPDLKPVNGLLEAFGLFVISSENGSMFHLTGESAQDFAFDELYPRSFASGDESLAFIGNDVAYGRQGRIESIRDTERFGDVEADDLSVQILDQVESFSDWTTVYNSRLSRVYFFPDEQSECWVYQKALRGTELSPWSKWTTQHPLAFRPTTVMNMLDPVDGLEYVFMGDSDGNIYRLEGTGEGGDGGTADINVSRTSALFSAPLNAEAYDIEGWVKYRKGEAATLTLTFLYAGDVAFDQPVTIELPEITNRPVYGGGLFYSDGNYYGTAFSGRLVRKKFYPGGQSSEFQIRAEINGTTDWQINEIGIRFRAASQ